MRGTVLSKLRVRRQLRSSSLARVQSSFVPSQHPVARLAGSCESQLLIFAESQQDAFLFLGLRFLSLRPPVVIAELCARHRPHLEGVIFSYEGEVYAEENLWAPGGYARSRRLRTRIVCRRTSPASANRIRDD